MYDTHIESKEVGDYRYTIYWDEDSENPRSDDTNIFEIFVPKAGRDPRNPMTEFNDVDSFKYEKATDTKTLKEALDNLRELPNVAVARAIYMYDHSGVSLNFDAPVDRWDSSFCGFAVVTRANYRKTHEDKYIEAYKEDLFEEMAEELKVLSGYISGEVYLFSIEKKVLCDHGIHEWETVESIGGYYDIDRAREDAEGLIEYLQKEDLKVSQEELKVSQEELGHELQ